jgi:hypothetical protein
VPDEVLVNKDHHKDGRDFDLLAQFAKIRHDFVSSSAAAQDTRRLSVRVEQRRQLNVIVALVDLEFSLDKLVNVRDKAGTFHRTAIGRIKLQLAPTCRRSWARQSNNSLNSTTA